MRLGDLDALKEAIKDNGYSHYFEIFDIIDQAPTVPQINLFCENADEKAIEDMKAELQNVLDSERQKGEWIPVSERLPEGKIDPHTNDFEIMLCTTIWEDVRPYRYGKLIGENKAHFWLCGGIMDKYITAWQPLPEPYKRGES